jgi:hypothetical protein
VKRVALLSVLLISASAAADPGAGEFEGLAGLTFDVTAEVTYSDDPALPAGTVFENCYFFNEDGVWFDPLYPDFGVAIPGYWVQHSMLPKITYTATVSETAAAGGPFAGLMLTQNGVVTPGPDNGNKKLLAYTTVYFGGWPIVEVVSIGRAVDDCPYF